MSLDVTWCHLINKFLVFCESGCKQGFHYSVIIPRKWWFLMCLQLPCRPKPQSKVLLLKQGFTSSWWDQIENNQLFQNIQSPWPVYNPTALHIYPLPTDQVAPTSSSACGEVSSAPAAGIQEWMSCCECAVAVKLKPCSMEHACGDPQKIGGWRIAKSTSGWSWVPSWFVKFCSNSSWCWTACAFFYLKGMLPAKAVPDSQPRDLAEWVRAQAPVEEPPRLQTSAEGSGFWGFYFIWVYPHYIFIWVSLHYCC